jgi:hypothetical protein
MHQNSDQHHRHRHHRHHAHPRFTE